MNIGSWFETWVNILTHPGEPSMEDERAEPQATLSTALIWVVIGAVITGIIGWIQAMIFARSLASMGGIQGIMQQAMQQANLPAEQVDAINQMMANLPAGVPILGRPGGSFGALIAAIVSAIIFFLIFVAVLQVVAKVLGGTGNYGKYAYLLAAAYIPITIISSLLGLIPFLGSCLSPLLTIYALILAYFATRVEHKLSQGRSIITVLAPLIIAAIVGCCVAFAAAGTIAALLNSGQ